MTDLLIRNLDPPLYARLKAHIAANHRSVEAAASALLHSGLARSEPEGRPEDLVSLATRLFGPERGVDLELPARDRAV